MNARDFRLVPSLALAGVTLCAGYALMRPSHVTDYPTTDPNPSACVGSVVVVYGDDPVGCDLLPGMRLDVVLPVDGTPESYRVAWAACEDMGGDRIYSTDPSVTYVTCEGVDF